MTAVTPAALYISKRGTATASSRITSNILRTVYSKLPRYSLGVKLDALSVQKKRQV
jgi:hypothetical protein